MEEALRLEAALRSPALAASDTSLAEAIGEALDAIASAIRLYSPNAIALAFNGGKDATVLLHLYRAALARYIASTSPDTHTSHNNNRFRIHALYLSTSNEFPEVAAFLEFASKSYSLSLHSTPPDIRFPDALAAFLKENPEVTAFAIGTRLADPHAHQFRNSLFAPSTPPYPPFMRMTPILRWDYTTVWRFLRRFQLPYCDLYDAGYTSLGSPANSRPNPALHIHDGPAGYLPAWMLRSDALERAGREDTQAGCQQPSDSSPKKVKTAAMLVAGNELLNGAQAEGNVFPAAQMLFRSGVALKKVVFVDDSLNGIANELRPLAKDFDIVLTSGGIGPTHDDVTMKGIAQAFGESMKREKVFETAIRSFFSKHGGLNDAHLKMADVPESAQLVFPDNRGNADVADFPLVRTRNVYSLPGVPKYFLKAIEFLESKLASQVHFYCRRMYLDAAEVDIAHAVEEVADLQKDRAQIGMYPFVDRKDCQTILRVESTSSSDVDRAVAELLVKLPRRCIIHVEDGTDLRSPASMNLGKL